MADFEYSDPELTRQALTIAARNKLAAALMEQAQEPVGANQPVGGGARGMPGYVPRYGGGNYLAKLAQMLGGAYLQKKNIDAATALRAQQIGESEQMMGAANVSPTEAAQAAEENVPGGGPPQAEDVRAAQSQAASGTVQTPMNPQGLPHQMMARWARQNPDQYGAYIARLYAPNEGLLTSQQNLAAGGPWAQAEQSRLAAAQRAPVQGGLYMGPDKRVHYQNAPAAGTNATIDQDGNVLSESQPAGATDITANQAAATAAGAAQGSRTWTDESGAQHTSFPEGVTTFHGGAATPAPRVEKVGQSTAAQSGTTAGVEQMNAHYGTLTQQVSSSNQVLAGLEGLKKEAKSANTGDPTNRLAFINKLLGFVNKKAENIAEANDLMDKNSAMIVAILSGGNALGTDAARQLVQLTVPNRHMEEGAIDKAADIVAGSQYQLKAKQQALLPHRMKNDWQGFAQKESAFDQTSDPRLQLLLNMNSAQRAAYVGTLSDEEKASIKASKDRMKAAGLLQ